MPIKKEQEPDSAWKQFGLFGVIVADLVGYTGAGLGLGYLLYTKAGAPAWILVITSMAGMVAAFYQIYVLMKSQG